MVDLEKLVQEVKTVTLDNGVNVAYLELTARMAATV
jgi:hypothetical protein